MNADNPFTGKFVSESKFTEDPATFIPHILQRNSEALQDLITKPDVEKKLLLRLRKKAATYAQDIVDGDSKDVNSKANKIDVDGVVDLYESYIIPLTKEVEVRDLWSGRCVIVPDTLWLGQKVDYLLGRLDGLSKEEIDTLSKSKTKEP